MPVPVLVPTYITHNCVYVTCRQCLFITTIHIHVIFFFICSSPSRTFFFSFRSWPLFNGKILKLLYCNRKKRKEKETQKKKKRKRTGDWSYVDQPMGQDKPTVSVWFLSFGALRTSSLDQASGLLGSFYVIFLISLVSFMAVAVDITGAILFCFPFFLQVSRCKVCTAFNNFFGI